MTEFDAHFKRLAQIAAATLRPSNRHPVRARPYGLAYGYQELIVDRHAFLDYCATPPGISLQ
jgi:hypothetical protein